MDSGRKVVDYKQTGWRSRKVSKFTIEEVRKTQKLVAVGGNVPTSW